eukprot:TRINITY_DN18016_c0_g2_i3.p1 TRINITY_DN18016_c0_g2~~TRINITY_DN18016_c0_g2_i3.p1  ORF type:complete len:293 (-),score=51.91 TRINITY_DN18016_c0_g2_i3:35-913(-)
MMSYLVTIGTSFGILLGEWTEASDFILNYRFSMLLFAMFVVFPVVLIRDFGHLGIVAFFALFSVITITFFISVHGPDQGTTPSLDLFRSEFFSALGGIAFTMLCQHAALHAYRSMTPMNIPSWHTAIFTAVGCGLSIICWTSVAGYVSFGPNVEDEILDSFPDSDIGTQVMRGLLIVHLCLYIPVEFLVARHSLLKLVNKDVKRLPLVPYVLLTILLLAILFGLASITDDFGLVLDVTGGVAGSGIGFILPAMIYLKACGRELGPARYYAAWVTVGFGVFVFVGTMYGVGTE